MKEGHLVSNYLRLDIDGDYVTQSSPCPFLASDNSCNIYEDRPSDCVRYPYTDEDVLLKRPGLTLKNVTVCPATFLVMEKLLEMEVK
jgi:Fe-S-cluster containining protein